MALQLLTELRFPDFGSVLAAAEKSFLCNKIGAGVADAAPAFYNKGKQQCFRMKRYLNTAF